MLHAITAPPRAPACRDTGAPRRSSVISPSRQIIRHTLRHSSITHLVQAGVDLVTVKRISGHKTLQMFERYAHAQGRHVADAVDAQDCIVNA
ncbi:tyrosine-type recombinase/integrase [Burkholderia sp. S-53]|uniref:tyrosine-type recombinase/integrase n=1 Tax=Burkholderia sp. S-53 TaxID=2906514 RepID=UPI00399BED30